MMAQYRGVALGELSPHVYAIAEQVGCSPFDIERLCSHPQRHKLEHGRPVFTMLEPAVMRHCSQHALRWCPPTWEANVGLADAHACRTKSGRRAVLYASGEHCSMPYQLRPPRPWRLLLQAYSAMMMDEQRQAILISGESGAGKTESAKMVMQVRVWLWGV